MPLPPLSKEEKSEIVELLSQRFVSRWDTYAERGWDAKNKRKNYIRNKSKLAKKRVALHVEKGGYPKNAPIGTYISAHIGLDRLPAPAFTLTACLDFDGGGWEDSVKTFYTVASEMYGLDVVIERSQSGNGAHIWGLFKEPTLAYYARTIFKHIAEEAGITIKKASGEGSIIDLLYPIQIAFEDPDHAVGNLVALPLAAEPYSRECSVFLNPETLEPAASQLDFLRKIKLISKEEVIHLASVLNLKTYPSTLAEFESAALPTEAFEFLEKSQVTVKGNKVGKRGSIPESLEIWVKENKIQLNFLDPEEKLKYSGPTPYFLWRDAKIPEEYLEEARLFDERFGPAPNHDFSQELNDIWFNEIKNNRSYRDVLFVREYIRKFGRDKVNEAVGFLYHMPGSKLVADGRNERYLASIINTALKHLDAELTNPKLHKPCQKKTIWDTKCEICTNFKLRFELSSQEIHQADEIERKLLEGLYSIEDVEFTKPKEALTLEADKFERLYNDIVETKRISDTRDHRELLSPREMWLKESENDGPEPIYSRRLLKEEMTALVEASKLSVGTMKKSLTYIASCRTVFGGQKGCYPHYVAPGYEYQAVCERTACPYCSIRRYEALGKLLVRKWFGKEMTAIIFNLEDSGVEAGKKKLEELREFCRESDEEENKRLTAEARKRDESPAVKKTWRSYLWIKAPRRIILIKTFDSGDVKSKLIAEANGGELKRLVGNQLVRFYIMPTLLRRTRLILKLIANCDAPGLAAEPWCGNVRIYNNPKEANVYYPNDKDMDEELRSAAKTTREKKNGEGKCPYCQRALQFIATYINGKDKRILCLKDRPIGLSEAFNLLKKGVQFRARPEFYKMVFPLALADEPQELAFISPQRC